MAAHLPTLVSTEEHVALVSRSSSLHRRKIIFNVCTQLCFLDVVKSCGSVITSNYTYWQSPAVISSGSICPLTIRLNSEMLGAGAPSIVQVRCVLIINYLSVLLKTKLTTHLSFLLLVWILYPSPSASHPSIRFVVRIHLVCPAHRTVCQSFAATTLANTVIINLIIILFFMTFSKLIIYCHHPI